MKISYNWLKNYIDFEETPETLSTILTDIGLEVEGTETFETIKGGLEGVVVGQIKSCEKHPNADRLSLTTVDVGSNGVVPIVCGAPNVATGQKVLVATVGTTLFPNNEEFTIKKTKIRGEVSEGMICAEDELGLGDNHDGIIVLPADTRVGTQAKDFYKIEKDIVFEIGLTPNRVDAASHYGVARDLAAFFSLTKETKAKKPTVEHFEIDENIAKTQVIIENSDACPRYCGLSIQGAEVKESPEWLQNKLKAIGLNPINNIVDITNFVLHETGHPLHAFDAEKIAGDKVIIKNLANKTKFKTLDEIERELSAEDLMICDTEKGIALAGVFGGFDSGVSETTKNIFLESAYFNSVSIRKSAKRHGLSTDASFRFERGADPEMAIYAMKRAALLIKELAGGKICSDIIDEYPNKINNFNVSLSWYNVNRLIGREIDKEIVKKIILALEMKITEEHDKGLEIIVPSYRVDVQREVDIIEDILRLYGYNNIEIPAKVNTSLTYGEKPDKEAIINRVSNYLAANGYNEIWSNSLTKAEYYEKTEGFNVENLARIVNPLSNDLNAMRSTLLFGGLEAIIYNTNRQNADIQLFEFGYNYFFNNDPSKKGKVENYTEKFHLGLFVTGLKTGANWINGNEPSSFFTLKSHVENLLDILGINSQHLKVEETKNPSFDKAIQYSRNKSILVEIGLVKKEILKQFDIEKEVFYANFHFHQVLSQLRSAKAIKYKEIAKFPAVKRDLALLLDKQITFGQIKDIAMQTERDLLKNITLFDVYEGKNIEKGKKSYAVNFILQDPNKTLNDKQIDKIMNRFIGAFENELGAKIR